MSEINTEESIEQGIPEITLRMQVFESVQAPVDATLSIAGQAADAQATGLAIAAAKSAVEEEVTVVDGKVSALAGLLFPVGSIYVSTSDTAPTFGGENWNWQEIMLPATWGDIEDGARSYAAKGLNDTPGTVHFWLRIADTATESEET